MQTESKYFNPYATIADIEVLMNVSHRTAERMMSRMKRELGIKRWKRPTKGEVELYFSRTRI